MTDISLVWPILAQAVLTTLVLLLLPTLRLRALLSGQARIKDYRYGDTENVPMRARLVNRNFLNLLQMPILFYVVCILFIVTNTTTELATYLAWSFVALRVIHSIIHIGYNNITHRFLAFVASTVVLTVLWIEFVLRVG